MYVLWLLSNERYSLIKTNIMSSEPGLLINFVSVRNTQKCLGQHIQRIRAQLIAILKINLNKHETSNIVPTTEDSVKDRPLKVELDVSGQFVC